MEKKKNKVIKENQRKSQNYLIPDHAENKKKKKKGNEPWKQLIHGFRAPFSLFLLMFFSANVSFPC